MGRIPWTRSSVLSARWATNREHTGVNTPGQKKGIPTDSSTKKSRPSFQWFIRCNPHPGEGSLQRLERAALVGLQRLELLWGVRESRHDRSHRSLVTPDSLDRLKPVFFLRLDPGLC